MPAEQLSIQTTLCEILTTHTVNHTYNMPCFTLASAHWKWSTVIKHYCVDYVGHVAHWIDLQPVGSFPLTQNALRYKFRSCRDCCREYLHYVDVYIRHRGCCVYMYVYKPLRHSCFVYMYLCMLCYEAIGISFTFLFFVWSMVPTCIWTYSFQHCVYSLVTYVIVTRSFPSFYTSFLPLSLLYLPIFFSTSFLTPSCHLSLSPSPLHFLASQIH